MNIRWILLLAVLTATQTARSAEPQIPNNPYAKSPQSTLSSWPPYYHLPPGDNAYYYRMGWCGIKHHGPIYDRWYREHALLNINAMPETSWEGEIVEVAGPFLKARQPDGESVTILANPSLQVTDLRMVGATDAKALARGVWVHFVGEVDREGAVAAPVAQLEVYTPRPDDQLQQVVPGERQVIAGRLVAKDDSAWELKPAVRSRFNAVRFTLAADARLMQDVAQLNLAKPGQKITVRGRLFDVMAQLKEIQRQAVPGYFQQMQMLEEPEPVPLPSMDDPSVKAMRPIIFACRMTVDLGSNSNPQAPPPRRASDVSVSRSAN
jgi:hypothetical protein